MGLLTSFFATGGFASALPGGFLRRWLSCPRHLNLHFFGSQGLADMIFYGQAARARLRGEPDEFDFS